MDLHLWWEYWCAGSGLAACLICPIEKRDELTNKKNKPNKNVQMINKAWIAHDLRFLPSRDKWLRIIYWMIPGGGRIHYPDMWIRKSGLESRPFRRVKHRRWQLLELPHLFLQTHHCQLTCRWQLIFPTFLRSPRLPSIRPFAALRTTQNYSGCLSLINLSLPSLRPFAEFILSEAKCSGLLRTGLRQFPDKQGIASLAADLLAMTDKWQSSKSSQ